MQPPNGFDDSGFGDHESNLSYASIQGIARKSLNSTIPPLAPTYPSVVLVSPMTKADGLAIERVNAQGSRRVKDLLWPAGAVGA